MSFHSQLLEDVEDELTQVLVDVPPAGVEPLRDVLKCLKEAVEVHLGVLAPPHHVLVNYVVVGLADVRVCHIFKFSQSLKLVARDEVVVLLACQDFKDGLSLRIQVQFVIVAFWVWQDQLQQALLRWPSIHGGILLLGCCGLLLSSLALLSLRILSCLFIKDACS